MWKPRNKGTERNSAKAGWSGLAPFFFLFLFLFVTHITSSRLGYYKPDAIRRHPSSVPGKSRMMGADKGIQAEPGEPGSRGSGKRDHIRGPGVQLADPLLQGLGTTHLKQSDHGHSAGIPPPAPAL